MSKFTFGFYLDIRIPLKDGSYSIGVRLYDKKIKKGLNFSIPRVGGVTLCAKSEKEWESI